MVDVGDWFGVGENGWMIVILFGVIEICCFVVEFDVILMKKFGQNFVIDVNIVCKIVQVVCVQFGECVVEVGLGFGLFILVILEIGVVVMVVEIDYWLVVCLLQIVVEYGVEVD